MSSSDENGQESSKFTSNTSQPPTASRIDSNDDDIDLTHSDTQNLPQSRNQNDSKPTPTTNVSETSDTSHASHPSNASDASQATQLNQNAQNTQNTQNSANTVNAAQNGATPHRALSGACVTCGREVKRFVPGVSDLSDLNDLNDLNDLGANDANGVSGVNVFDRQCAYTMCATRGSDGKGLQCEQCSDVSGCRGCGILLCASCRQTVGVLACAYKGNVPATGTSSNNTNNNESNNMNAADKDCNEFICSRMCYKNVIAKYNVLLRFNGFDANQHESITKLKKLFWTPYLSGLYDTLHLPTRDQFATLFEMTLSEGSGLKGVENGIENGKEEVLKAVNAIDWRVKNKDAWFPFHECQGCKKHNCGCTEWICCVDCRKYYCEECARRILAKCRLEECENYTCCKGKIWNRNCVYCNDLGNCQLLFCTRGHCDRHYIMQQV